MVGFSLNNPTVGNGMIRTWNGVAFDLMTVEGDVHSILYQYRAVIAMTTTDVDRAQKCLWATMLWRCHLETDFLDLDLKIVMTDLKTVDYL